MPEQRPLDMDSLVDTRRVFEKTLKETMQRIAVDTYRDEVNPEAYSDVLNEAYERFFNSMKGATNLHQSDIEELITAEITRQGKLYERIKALEQYFDKVKPLNPSEVYADAYWYHGPSSGLNVEINGTRFYALPRVPCSTDEYITVKQAPVPANIVLIEHDMILMLPYYEDISEKTRLQLAKLIDVSGQITEDGIKEPIKLGKNYLWVHSEERIDERLINELINKYKAEAFMVGYPSRNIAIIYTGEEESIERLWKTMCFDWDEMWRRYSWYE